VQGNLLKTNDLPFVFIKLTHICKIGLLLNVFYRTLDNCRAKPWKLLEEHSDYDAAKNHEDCAAAMRLVHFFLKIPENQIQLRNLKKQYPGTVIVPIRAVEAGGKNRIPLMLAEYISKKTGFEVDTSVVQTNQVHRTGTYEWYRFAFMPSFDG
jgi:hypothetical protein